MKKYGWKSDRKFHHLRLGRRPVYQTLLKSFDKSRATTREVLDMLKALAGASVRRASCNCQKTHSQTRKPKTKLKIRKKTILHKFLIHKLLKDFTSNRKNYRVVDFYPKSSLQHC